MDLVIRRSNLLKPYLLLLLWFLLTVFVSFKTTAFSISLSFLLMIFVPGFSLIRIFRISYQNFVEGLIFALTLGLIANLTLSLAGILFGLTIGGLEFLMIAAIVILFLLALVLDLKRGDQKLCLAPVNLKDIFQRKNLIYLFLVLLVILVLSTVDQLGTNFTGDPLDHLAIMRKAIEGMPLTMENLSHAKNQITIAYALPVWHVFLTVLVKLNQTTIFIFYREITTILALLVFLVWYWLFKKILPTRSVAILALFLFILFHFEKNGYLFTRLPVPDSLNMLLLMPLCFGLAINYIFQKEATYKHLIILSLILLLMGLIHWTQYFYWLSAMGLLAILYLIFKFQDKDFQTIFKKILLAIFTNMIFVIPILAFIQLKARVVSQNLEEFTSVTKGSTNDRLYKFDPYFKLSYILLPLIGVFFRKYRTMVFILAVFLIGPIVYNIPWLYGLLRHYLSHVFVNRLYSNLGQWPFIIWAILLGFILVLIDRLLSKIKPSRKYLRFLIDGILGIFLFWMVWSQFQSGLVQNWYNFIFSGAVFEWLNANYHWLIPVVVLIALTIYILQEYYPKLLDFFQFQEYQNHSTMLLLTLVIVFFLGIQSFSHLTYYSKEEFQNWHFFQEATDPTADFINYDKFGGVEAIDFIKNNIPAKSVFDTNTFANYTLPTLVDMHMASYTLDPIAPTKKYQDLYDVKVAIEKKVAMLKEGDIDYLIYQSLPTEESTPLDAYPEYFVKIYGNNKAAIFQINKSVF